MKYNYVDALETDILNYIEENVDLSEWIENRRGLEEHLYNVLFAEDSVTGGTSGSYVLDEHEAEEYISENSELLEDALNGLGDFGLYIRSKGAQVKDMVIRSFLLKPVLNFILDVFENEGAFNGLEADVAE